MFISDTAIKRPILTVVAMLAIVVFGVAALTQLDTDEYPEIDAPVVAVAVPYGVMLGLHMSDNLLNAFPNPMFMLMAGGLVSLPALAHFAAQHAHAVALAQRRQQPRAAHAAGRPDAAASPAGYPAISGVAPQNFPQR